MKARTVPSSDPDIATNLGFQQVCLLPGNSLAEFACDESANRIMQPSTLSELSPWEPAGSRGYPIGYRSSACRACRLGRPKLILL